MKKVKYFKNVNVVRQRDPRKGVPLFLRTNLYLNQSVK